MKKGILFCSIFVSLLFISPCITLGLQPHLVIKGKVIDKHTLMPIQGGFVEIENTSGGSGYSRAYTDEKGEFLFKNLPAGVSFNLYVEKEGYTSFRRRYWNIDENKEIETIVLKISKEAILQCRVTASDKTTPIKRARVNIKPMKWRRDQYAVYEFERETNDNGEVTIEKIPEGTYELIIEKSGYIRERLTNIAFITEKDKEMDVALYRPASISGKILLIDKETTLAGIPIISRGPSAKTSTSNFKGSYSLRDLKPGTYGFTANRAGFKTYIYRGEITVREGEDINRIDHYLEAEAEKVKIAIYQEVYPIKDKIKFAVRAFRSEDFELQFHRIPIKWYMRHPHAFQGLLERESSLDDFKVVYNSKYGFKRYRPYRWFSKEIRAEKAFSPGIYLVRATTANAEDRNFIFVSNIGVIVKRGKGSLMAYTVNFETNKPESGVGIYVMKGKPQKKDAGKSLFQRILGLFRNDLILLEGKTDKKGIFLADQRIADSDLLVIGLKEDQGVGISESYLSSAAETRGARYFFYTDRPVYRPSHRVFFKGLLRIDDGADLKIKAHHDVRIQIKDPKDHVIKTLNQASDHMGTLNGSFDLPSDAPLGRYTLWTTNGKRKGHVAYFFVQAYRKPDFKVDVETDKKAYVTDETIKCRIRAAYFFGSPLSNAGITYRVYQKMTHKPYYRYWWEGEYYRSEGYQSLIKSGKAKTDVQGFVSIHVLPQPKSYDRMITIVAEVMATSGRKVTGRKSVIYNQSLYQMDITQVGYIHKMENPLKFRVAVKDINGSPVKTDFSVSLEQEVWNPIRNRYEKPMTPLYSQMFQTDKSGHALIDVPLSELKPGYTRIIVSAADSKGNSSVKSRFLWLYDSLHGNFNYNYAGLEIWLDKKDYREGETAKLLINTPIDKGVILFTMEGQNILSHQVIGMTSRSRILEIPVRKKFAPNVYVSVIQHDGNRLYHKKVSLNVAIEGKEMNIETRFDKQEYGPGETALLQIKATDHEGAPVKGDFSVGVVDEAIYYIRPDHTTPIHSYFYAKRSPWISTTYSFPIRYLGGAVKSAGDRTIRKDFKDTAFWLPNLSTDEKGKGKAEIPLPDNLTTWVTTIRGHSADNIFGEKKEKCLVTKPLVTSLKLPRFFIRGDRTEVRVVNYNRTETPLENVRNRLMVETPLSLLGPAEKTIQIPKQGTGQLSWRVEVEKGPEKSTLTIRTDSETLHDGEQRSVPVLSRGLPKVYDFSGRTKDHVAVIDILLPADHVLELTSLEIEFTPHPALAGLTSLDYLSNFPYGCVEQTMNSFIPLASYYAALKRFGMMPGDMDKITSKMEKGLARLERCQRSDGAFGWWKDSEPDLYLTSLVLLGLSKIKGVDNKRIQLIISRSAKYLKREIAKTKLFDVLAFGLYALSEAGYEHRALARSLKSNLQSKDALLLSFTALALANHNMMTDAVKAMDHLMGKIEKTEAGSFFPEPETYRDRGAIETAAYALMALLRIDPDNPEIDQIMKWLVLRKTGRYWVSTKTTGVVVAALSEYLMTHKDKIPINDQTITLSLNKHGVTDFQIKKADFLIGVVKPQPLPSSSLTQGVNQLKIDCAHDLYYALRIKSFWESDSIAPSSKNCKMSVSKKISAVTRVHDSRGNPRILTRPLEENERLQVGEEIKIQVNFTPDRDYDYFILEDGLPSGFEAVEFEKEAGMSWWHPYTHKEKRDDKVVFFFDHLPKGRGIAVSYILRSELNGQFNLPPARLFGMYRPFVNTHSSSKRLMVGP